MVGEAPDWYPLVRASRYLGVPPWELAKQQVFWRDIALMAESAEIGAEGDRAARRAEKAEAQKNAVSE